MQPQHRAAAAAPATSAADSSSFSSSSSPDPPPLTLLLLLLLGRTCTRSCLRCSRGGASRWLGSRPPTSSSQRPTKFAGIISSLSLKGGGLGDKNKAHTAALLGQEAEKSKGNAYQVDLPQRGGE